MIPRTRLLSAALTVLATLAVALAACRTDSAGSVAASPAPRPLLVFGGTIHVGDGAGTTVEALAIHDRRIVYAGDLAGAAKAAGEDAHTIDLAGAVAVPGLQDAHGHLFGLGATLEAVALQDTRSYDEVIERIAARAAELPEGAWITGRGWDQTRWPDAEFPHHAALSGRVPDHPVLVRRVDGHAALANAHALELAGLSGVLEPAPAIEGGRILLDGEGRATGVLIDAAMDLVNAHVPEPAAADLRRHALLAQEKLLAEGLTAVHEMGLSPERVMLLRELEQRGELKLRVHAYLWGNDGLEAEALAPLLAAREGRVHVAGVKLMIDGALGSRGAALIRPYQDAPEESGLLQMDQVELNQLVARCAKLGLQPATHAIGDRGNRAVLNAYAREAEIDPAFLALRPRIEHAQVVAESDWPRFGELGVIPSVQPRHATSDMRWAEERLGPERLRGAYAWRRLAAPNAPLAFGSDFPVEPSAPLLGLYAARTRQDEQGEPPEGFQPEHRQSGAEALAGFTTGAAFAAHEEHERGRLAQGFFADLTVLDVDPVACPPDALLSARVLLTVIEGEVVFDGR